MTQREALQAEWLKEAAKKCTDYEIVSRDFALQYDMPTLSGVIKCKKINKSGSSIAPLKTPSASATVTPHNTPSASSTDAPNNASSQSASMITNQNNTKVRKSPSSKAAIIKTLKKGDVVQIVKQKEEWFLIELSSGETGWCHNSVLSQKN